MYFVGMVLGTAVCYALGTAWLAYEAEMTFQAALMAGVIGSEATGFPAGSLTFIMYVIGVATVLVSAIILKKTKPFHGDAAPFVMELPAYHLPQAKTVLLHTWERLKGFIRKPERSCC